MKRVLFVVSATGQFAELASLALVLKASGKYEPLFFYNTGRPAYVGHVKTLAENGIECLDLDGRPVDRNGEDVGRPCFRRAIVLSQNRIIELLKRSVPYGFYYIARRLLRRELQKKLLKKHSPAVIVLAEDSPMYLTPELIQAGHSMGIPSVVFPYSLADRDEFAESVSSYIQHRVWWPPLWLVLLFFPRWKISHRGRQLSRGKWYEILSSELMSLAPPEPWAMNSGYADVIAVESRFAWGYFKRSGISESQMRLTGTIAQDDLSRISLRKQEYRKRLNQELELNETLPILLCAVPVEQPERSIQGFKSYDEFLGKFIEKLKDLKRYNLVFKFHPRMSSGEVKAQCDRYNIQAANWATAELIPVCDIFVASISATIRWAILCAKPIINLDFYQFRYRDYVECSNVATIETLEELERRLAEIQNGTSVIQKAAGNSQTEISSTGGLDGFAGHRILNLLDELSLNAERKTPNDNTL